MEPDLGVTGEWIELEAEDGVEFAEWSSRWCDRSGEERCLRVVCSRVGDCVLGQVNAEDRGSRVDGGKCLGRESRSTTRVENRARRGRTQKFCDRPHLVEWRGVVVQCDSRRLVVDPTEEHAVGAEVGALVQLLWGVFAKVAFHLGKILRSPPITWLHAMTTLDIRRHCTRRH